MEPDTQWQPHVVGQLEGRRPGPATPAIHDDEIDINTAVEHRLANGEDLVGHADTKLDADWLAAGKLAHFCCEFEHFPRCRKCRMTRR